LDINSLFVGSFSTRLNFVEPSISHSLDIRAYAFDVRFRRYLSDSSLSDHHVSDQFLELIINDNLKGVRKYWCISLKSFNAIIGTAGLIFTQDEGSAEIGFGISPRYWGYGYGHEAINMIILYAKHVNLKKLVIFTRADNLPAINVAKKCNFAPVSRLPSYYNYGHKVMHDGLRLELLL